MVNHNTRMKHLRRKRLFNQQVGLCCICDLPMLAVDYFDHMDSQYPTFEHLIPRSDGGGDTNRNVRLAHRHCNWARHHAEGSPERHLYNSPSVLPDSSRRNLLFYRAAYDLLDRKAFTELDALSRHGAAGGEPSLGNSRRSAKRAIFVRVVRDVLGDVRCEAIWRKARETEPDDPCWLTDGTDLEPLEATGDAP